MACLVIFRWNGGHVGTHHALQNVRVPRAPFIVIATPKIRPLDIDVRCEGFYTSIGTALTLDQISRIGLWIPPELAYNRALITDQPFIIDLIVDGVAIGDDAIA